MPKQMIVAERFFAESQAQKVIELGHRLVNLGFRAVALRCDWHKLVATGGRHVPDLTVAFSQERNSWISLNKSTANSLSRVCGKVGHQAARDLGQAILTLEQSGAWRDVEQQRGADFHRWCRVSRPRWSRCNFFRSGEHLRQQSARPRRQASQATEGVHSWRRCARASRRAKQHRPTNTDEGTRRGGQRDPQAGRAGKSRHLHMVVREAGIHEAHATMERP